SQQLAPGHAHQTFSFLVNYGWSGGEPFFNAGHLPTTPICLVASHRNPSMILLDIILAQRAVAMYSNATNYIHLRKAPSGCLIALFLAHSEMTSRSWLSACLQQ